MCDIQFATDERKENWTTMLKQYVKARHFRLAKIHSMYLVRYDDGRNNR